MLDIANIPLVSNVCGVYRFAIGLHAFLGHPISPEEHRAIVQQGKRQRPAALLRKLEGAVFGNPRSPYLGLFRNPGCTEETIDALLPTGCRPACSKVLLNADIGDYAVPRDETARPMIGKTERAFLRGLNKRRPAAFILGNGTSHTLGFVRSLGRRGIPVVVVSRVLALP